METRLYAELYQFTRLNFTKKLISLVKVEIEISKVQLVKPNIYLYLVGEISLTHCYSVIIAIAYKLHFGM